MRLERLDLARYGHFTDCSYALPAAASDLHLVFGGNEAGKSTARAAIEDLLFGIPAQSPYAFRHDYASMRIGAVLARGEQSLVLRRRKGNKDTLLDADDTPLPGGEAALRQFLAGADREFFRRMFCLDHERLESGGREILEARDEIGQMLFAAGSGVAGLRDTLAALNTEADAEWGPRKSDRRAYEQARNKFRDAERTRSEQLLTARQWQTQRDAFEAAEREYREAEQALEEVDAQSRRLARIRRVHRPLRDLAEVDTELAGLEDCVCLPADAQAAFETVQRREAEAAARADTLLGQLERARAALATLECDTRLLTRAEDVEALQERRIETRRIRDELPARRAELEAAGNTLRALAVELGWPETGLDGLAKRLPARAPVSNTRALLAERGQLASALGAGQAALQDAEARHARLREQLARHAAPVDTTRLAAAIRGTRESGDLSGRARAAAQQAAAETARVERLLEALRIEILEARQVAGLAVPAAAEVQAHRDHRHDWQGRVRDLEREIETTDHKLATARDELARAAKETELVDTPAVARARHRRDALWQLLRQRDIEHTALTDAQQREYRDALDDLPAAFEAALAAADALADRRFANAEAAGRQAERLSAVEAQHQTLERLRDRERLLVTEGETLSANWTALWASLPVDPGSPDAMLEWLVTHGELRAALDRTDQAVHECALRQAEEQEQRGALRGALAAFGVAATEREEAALGVLVERAERLCREQDAAAAERVRVQAELEESSQERDRRHRECERAGTDFSDWQDRWGRALAALGFARDLEPAAVEAQIETLERLREQVRHSHALHQQIAHGEQEVGAFETAATTLIQTLAADLIRQPADEALLEIRQRLTQARQAQDQRDSRQAEIDTLGEALATIEAECRQRRESIAHLSQAVNDAGDDALAAAIARSDRRRMLAARREALGAELEAQSDGLGLDELEAEAAHVDIDQLGAREQILKENLGELRQRLGAAADSRARARDAFQAIGGDAAAARAEAERQEALTELRAAAERYTRTRTSALLLHWAIDRYRRDKQAPLLRRAGELFALLTGGSFASLRVEFDEQDQAYLTGVRPDDEQVPVPGMSTGTADQLYLALRVAAVEDYLERAEALPFIADDLFVNFDDDRARAGLRVLAQLAQHTQVLFFTHHQHLLDLARDALSEPPAIIHLAPG